jgi:Uma2 family endonuclease
MVATVKDLPIPTMEQRGQRDASTLLVRRFSLEEFAEICHALPDDKLELINGEIIMPPPPDDFHIEQTIRIEDLLADFVTQVRQVGCSAVGSSAWYAVPVEMKDKWVQAGVKGPDHVCPDASICFPDYLRTKRRPPALLVIEVISISSRREIDRDLISKPEIYASLEIPTYWVLDRRDQSVWVHTAPVDGQYTIRAQHKGDSQLPAPGLDFLTITPAKIFFSLGSPRH